MIAAVNPATTVTCVTASGFTIPLPTVVATAVPEIAPRKLSTPAISTAAPGGSTRVATMVAMALAASWKPLTNSNASPSTMISRSSVKAVSIAQARGAGRGARADLATDAEPAAVNARSAVLQDD